MMEMRCLLDVGGLKFFRSANEVILCPGDSSGFIRPEYFDKVLNRNDGEQLMSVFLPKFTIIVHTIVR